MNKNEILKKYGDVPVKFSSYYKYSFTFTGIAPDGREIIAWFGGNADNIYRERVETNKEILLKDLWSNGIIIKHQGKIELEYNDPW